MARGARKSSTQASSEHVTVDGRHAARDVPSGPKLAEVWAVYPSDGDWYPAVVVSRDGDWVQVRFHGYAEVEWLEQDQVRAMEDQTCKEEVPCEEAAKPAPADVTDSPSTTATDNSDASDSACGSTPRELKIIQLKSWNSRGSFSSSLQRTLTGIRLGIGPQDSSPRDSV